MTECELEPTKLALTARDVAVALGISERSVWRMASSGEIPPPVRIGRCSRWRRSSLDAWLEKEERRVRRQHGLSSS